MIACEELKIGELRISDLVTPIPSPFPEGESGGRNVFALWYTTFPKRYATFPKRYGRRLFKKSVAIIFSINYIG